MPSASLGTQDEWHVLDYLRVLTKRRWTALSVFLAVVAVVALATYTAVPLYDARAQIMIESENQNVVTFQEVLEQDKATDYYQTQYKILQSRALARTTIERLGLWDHQEFGAKRDAEEEPETGVRRLVAAARTTLGSGVSRLSRLLGLSGPTAGVQSDEEPDASESVRESAVIQIFLSRVTVAPIKNSRLVDVHFTSRDPKLAASVANALVRAYIDRNLEFKFSASKEATDWLEHQLGDQRKRVEASENALQAYRETNDAVSSESAHSTTAQKLNDLNGALSRARMDRLQKEATYQEAAALSAGSAALGAVPAIAAKPAIERLRGELSTLERQQAELSKQLGDQHPDLISVRNSIQISEAKLQVEVGNAVRSLEADVQAARAQEEQFAQAVEAQKAELLALDRREIGYRALQRDATSNQQILQSLLQRTKETGISSELKTNNIRIIDEADVPRAPIWPQTQMNMLLGSLAGAILGIAMAFVGEYLDNKIKAPEEIRARLGLPCLGIVPLISRKEMPEIAPLLSHSVPAQFAEAFRIIRTRVMFSAEDEQRRSIVVTSTGPGEGKTLIASNLAVGLAMAGQRVLLVDADMRRPRVHEMFLHDREPGLSTLLSGSATDLRAVARPSTTANLSVISGGFAPSGNPAELLASPAFRTLLTQATQQFDWVILDSPPVMAVTDAALLAHTAAAVLFVVGAELTDVPNAVRAIEQLEEADARFVGAVLNKAKLRRNAYYYAKHHRREYSEYYAHTDNKPPATHTRS